MMRTARARWLKNLLLAFGLLTLLMVALGWYFLFRQVDQEFESDIEHFKYGSVGVEANSGIPLKVWQTLPKICANQLKRPGAGYRSFGFAWEEGKPTPVGMPVKTVGFERVGINCALCHTAKVRTGHAQTARLYIGAPSPTIDLQSYLRFLFSCANISSFSPDELLAAMSELSLLERTLYRWLIIPQTRKALLKQRLQLAWMNENPHWGPGRQDPFNPAKTQILRLPFDGTIGNSDIPPLWNMAQRKGHAFHWDGLNTSLQEVFLNSAIGNGASASSIDRESLGRMQSFVERLPAAVFPFAIDPAKASKGKIVYQQHCAECHSLGGKFTGSAISHEKVGTDRQRLDSWSLETAQAFMALDQYEWRYRHFRDTWGYVAPLLDGAWARAPYLHNGSVPTLRALLASPKQRPMIFYRGYNVYDPEDLGYQWRGQAAKESGFKFDTRVPGNRNSGHLWGTEISVEKKDALIEYLKTR